MLSRTEIERLAGMAHALRPDWRIDSLCTWLLASHQGRAYQDVAVALAWVACDPKTERPKRMDEAGPWWGALRATGSETGDHRYARCTEPGHRSFPAANCAACRSERIAADDNRADTLTVDPDQLDVTQRGVRVVRQAIANARRGDQP